MIDSLKKVPHGEQCDQALEHYLKISNKATHFSSLVPAAIEFYKKHYVSQGERKVVYTPGTLLDALNEGWTFDPWLNPSGRPIHIGDTDSKGMVTSVEPAPTLSVYWILVKGTPDQIAGMDPIAELPELEAEPEPGTEPYGLKTIFIAYNSEETAPDGYVVMHKDHIFAKGTVYTLPPKRTADITA